MVVSGKDEESEDGNEQVVVGALQVIGREVHEDQDDAREGEQEDDEQAGHRLPAAIVAVLAEEDVRGIQSLPMPGQAVESNQCPKRPERC